MEKNRGHLLELAFSFLKLTIIIHICGGTVWDFCGCFLFCELCDYLQTLCGGCDQPHFAEEETEGQAAMETSLGGEHCPEL